MTTENITKALSKKDLERQRILGAFLKLGEIYNVGRQGIIVSFNGIRVGNWKWDTNRMLVSAINGDVGNKFRKTLREIIKEGVMTSEVRTSTDDALETQIFYKLTEISKLAPGELDGIMRDSGYFVIDSNLPVLANGEEGSDI